MGRKKQKEQIVTPKDIQEDIIVTEFEDEMRNSYRDYAIAVIVDRALADIRDGFKPVQRRILYAMNELKLDPTSAYKKSARVVGETMGKYHAHGDSSIYGAMVHMSEDFRYNYPLVDGHGNFGSIEGDGAAAQRYTEARLSDYVKELFFNDINYDTIDFIPNYDESEKEPTILPARVPNLLISGSEGIACGMAASIPTHNANEVIDATIALLKKPKMTIAQLMDYIQGPDFATGGVISNKNELLEIYSTGQGKLRVRGSVHFEDINNKPCIVIDEIPQTMVGSIDKFMDQVADLVRSKKISDITDIINMTSKDGVRIVIELKKDANKEKILNYLYKKTKLEDTFGVNLLAVEGNIPKIYNLKEMLEAFLKFQFEINNRKYKYLLGKEEITKEIKLGLIEACDNIDLIISIFRNSKTKNIVRKCLMTGDTSEVSLKNAADKKAAKKFHFTENQTNAIMGMQLQSLIGLERERLQKEYESCCKKIEEYNGYLTSDVKMKHLIEKELLEAKQKMYKERKTKICDIDEVVLEKEEVAEEEYVLLIDRFLYAKFIDLQTYERNSENIETDYKYVIPMYNTDRVYIFTNNGYRHFIDAAKIPVTKYKEKGVPLENVSNLKSNEKVVLISTEFNMYERKMLFITEQGFVKIVAGEQFVATRKTIDATKFKDNDQILNIFMLEKEKELVLITENQLALRFSINEISEIGKNSVGMIGITLKENEKLDAAFIGNTSDIFTYQDKKFNFKDILKKKRAARGQKL